MGTLVIGCGNPDRGDDGAGILVARRLRELGLHAVENTGDMVGLIDTWSEAEQAIIVDTVVTGASPGSVQRWDGRRAPLRRESFRSSSHSLGVAEAVELARLLDRLPPRLWIYGIEGSQFEPGAGVSAAVAGAVEQVAQEILLLKAVEVE